MELNMKIQVLHMKMMELNENAILHLFSRGCLKKNPSSRFTRCPLAKVAPAMEAMASLEIMF